MAIATDRNNSVTLSGTTPKQVVPPSQPGMKNIIDGVRNALAIKNNSGSSRDYTLRYSNGSIEYDLVETVAAGNTAVFPYSWEIEDIAELLVLSSDAGDTASIAYVAWDIRRA